MTTPDNSETYLDEIKQMLEDGRRCASNLAEIRGTLLVNFNGERNKHTGVVVTDQGQPALNLLCETLTPLLNTITALQAQRDEREYAELNAIYEIRQIIEPEPGKLMLSELVEAVRQMQGERDKLLGLFRELLDIAECDANTAENSDVILRAQAAARAAEGGEDA